MTNDEKGWPPETICLDATADEVHSLASLIYACVCRFGFAAPGFCLVNVGTQIDSVKFRQLMVDLKTEMAAIHETSVGKTLICLSALRVDQQNSTKPHLDGGPDESILILGYEPSEIASEIEILDYARSAADLGLSPKEFMERHNPMFRSEEELLRPYVTSIPCFRPGDFQILVVNNSSAALDSNSWQGALHTARIPAPDPSKRRVMNSILIASAPIGSADALSPAEMRGFIHTSLVRRRGDDKPDLADDV